MQSLLRDTDKLFLYSTRQFVIKPNLLRLSYEGKPTFGHMPKEQVQEFPRLPVMCIPIVLT